MNQKQVVSKKLPTVGQGAAGTGRIEKKPTSEMVVLPDSPSGKTTEGKLDRPEATPRPLETSTGTASAQGANPDPAEEQQAQSESHGTQENSAPTAGSSEAADPGVAGVESPPRSKKVKPGTKASPRKGKDEVKEVKEVKERPGRAPHSSRPPHRRRSAPGPNRTPRATSEPPQTAQTALSDGAQRTPRSLGDPRLPKLLMDIESHFRRVERKLPLDASGWLRETAQLELFEEELQWILQQHEPPPEEATPDASPSGETETEPKFVESSGKTGDEATEAGDASPTEPEVKDLDTALQQLKYCEREHAYLQQMLGYDDVIFREERLAEIREVEEEIDFEQRRVRHMETEHRKRERTLARAAARAVSMSANDNDGNGRAMRNAEQFESESAVWQVKNESMQKQVLQLNIYLKQDLEKLEQLNSKLTALREKLETDEAKQWIEEQRLREEERWNEEQALAAEVRALQDRRTFEEQACKRSHLAQLKQIADLRKKQTVLEPRLAQLEATEKQLRRQLKQLTRRKRRESRSSEAPLNDATGGQLPGQADGTETEDETGAALHVATSLLQHAGIEQSGLPEGELGTDRTVAESLAQHAFASPTASASSGPGPSQSTKLDGSNEVPNEQSATTNKGQVAETLAQYVLEDQDQDPKSSARAAPKEQGSTVQDPAVSDAGAVLVEEIGREPARADQPSRIVGVAA